MKLTAHSKKDIFRREWDSVKNTISFEAVGTGAGKVWWICSRGHSYEMAVHNRIRGQSCLRCKTPGLVDDVTDSVLATHKDTLSYFSELENVVKLSDIAQNYKAALIWRCQLDHTWKSTVAVQIARCGECPYCSYEKFLKGHNSLPQTHPTVMDEWDYSNDTDPYDVFYKHQYSVKWICRECAHQFTAKVSRRVRADTKCPACAGNVIIQGKTDLPSFAPELVKDFDELGTGRPATTVGKSHTVSWICDKGHSYKASVANKLKGYGFCSVCRPSLGSSKPEREVLAFVQELLPSYLVVHRSRAVISPYELDIYVPELNKAIEFNGDYWHSDAYRIPAGLTPADEYHKMKFDRCKTVGVDLAYIWGSGWPTDRAKAQIVVMRALDIAHLIEWIHIEC